MNSLRFLANISHRYRLHLKFSASHRRLNKQAKKIFWFVFFFSFFFFFFFFYFFFFFFFSSSFSSSSSSSFEFVQTSKTLFIIPNDAHNYKIVGMLKTIKIPTIAPTCFGSHRNHHQGAISCLAKTTVMILLCSSLMTWPMLWRHTSLLCKLLVHSTLAQQATMPP